VIILHIFLILVAAIAGYAIDWDLQV